MKTISWLLLYMLFWYLIFLIPCSNFNPFEWGAGAKVIYVIFVILSLADVKDIKKTNNNGES